VRRLKFDKAVKAAMGVTFDLAVSLLEFSVRRIEIRARSGCDSGHRFLATADSLLDQTADANKLA
jgi:hypothetical protein